MTLPNALDSDIGATHLTIPTRCAILNSIWGSNYTVPHLTQDESIGSSYLRYYGEQCRNALHSKGLDALVATHADIVDTIQQLGHPSATRESVKDHLRARLPTRGEDNTEELLCETIDLAVRLLLMVDIGKLQHGFVPGQRPLLWEGGGVKKLLRDRFGSQGGATFRIVRVKLDRLFTARNLERIAGLQIVWSDNLSDHLRLMVDDTRIAIYHHASFLEHHKNSTVFPLGFIEETQRTLSLLFPQYDKQSRKWFKAQQRKFGLDSRACAAGHLTTEERQIENFTFWHDRLGILKQVFDEAEPRTIAQWWCDRRRRVQWYTFWVAAVVLTLTIFFGMVQCIEGGFQVYKAYYPS